ncbi:hypothetical protein REH65_12520 [Saccharopolyspora sp. ID03-671]|uniref:hypothetical protein n=1 Tax=Saccharopolyspora sp. ID03-671 TaxID=3073066 RepID=UPI00324E5A1B
MSRNVPSSANAMPAEQITTYFHAASTAGRVRRCPTRNAVTMVVASTATHSIPRFAANTASAIAARNNWTSRQCRAAVRELARPAMISVRRWSGVAAVAKKAMAPITTSMNALSASTRSNPAKTV